MNPATIRLHITPFYPDLLRAVIPAPIAGRATNISFHTLETFPESSYGYVELPAMEAEKVRKKLNGAILKGKKVKIEEARPSKRSHGEADLEEQRGQSASGTTPKLKKAKKNQNLIPGHELSSERTIKRGWTEVRPEKTKKSKNKKEQTSSKYSEKKELLFRTKLPANKVESLGKNKKEKKSSNERVVHEFEKSVAQPSFLRDVNNTPDSRSATSYVDGKGWLDKEGVVIVEEDEKVSSKRARADQARAETARKSRSKVSSVQLISSSSGSEQSSEIGPDEAEDRRNALRIARKSEEIIYSDIEKSEGQSDDADETSSSGTSTDSDSDIDSSSDAQESEDRIVSRPQITVTTETPPDNPQAGVHPLEALFKRPSKPASQDIAKPSLELQTSFSFFDPNGSEAVNEDADLTMVPGTPFSSQDVRSRGMRSAAPTPDTAYPSRFNSHGSVDPEDQGNRGEDDKVMAKSSQTRTLRSGKEKLKEGDGVQLSDFEKKFWEHRGDNNRAWKQRRRETLKEKRQKENRARKNRNW